MKTLAVKKMELPLTKQKFRFLRNSIRTGQIKWMDMSNDMMFAYLDFWKSDKYKSMNDIIQD